MNDPGTTGALIRAALADPHDDLPRLVLADWLDDTGDHDRAEFVRAQVAAARLPAGDPERASRQFAARRLLDRHAADWLGEWADQLRPADDVERAWANRAWFERGLLQVQRSAATLAALPLEAGGPLAWLEGLSLTQHTADDVARLAGRPGAARIGRLAATGIATLDRSGDRVAGAVAASPHFTALTRLDLSLSEVSARGVEQLVESPLWPQLTELELMWNEFGPEAAQLIARAAPRCRLRRLGLARCQIGNAGAEALARADWPGTLRELVLRRNDIANAGADAVLASPRMRQLEFLDLGENRIDTRHRYAINQRFGAAVPLI